MINPVEVEMAKSSTKPPRSRSAGLARQSEGVQRYTLCACLFLHGLYIVVRRHRGLVRIRQRPRHGLDVAQNVAHDRRHDAVQAGPSQEDPFERHNRVRRDAGIPSCGRRAVGEVNTGASGRQTVGFDESAKKTFFPGFPPIFGFILPPETFAHSRCDRPCEVPHDQERRVADPLHAPSIASSRWRESGSGQSVERSAACIFDDDVVRVGRARSTC